METTIAAPAATSSIARLYGTFTSLLDKAQPLFALAIRLYVAKVFIVSGLLKFSRR